MERTSVAFVTTALTFLHILFGVAWIGAALLITIVIFPVGSRMSPHGRAEFVAKFMPRIAPYMAVVSILTLIFGVLLAYDATAGNFSTFNTTSWGVWISVGALLSLIAFVVGELLILPQAKKFEKTLKQIETDPSQERLTELDTFMNKLDRLGHIALVFLLLTLVAMVSAVSI